MTDYPPAASTRTLASIESEIAGAVTDLLTLDQAEWKVPGSTTRKPSAEDLAITAGRGSGLIHSPSGANLDVLECLADATRQVDLLVAAMNEHAPPVRTTLAAVLQLSRTGDRLRELPEDIVTKVAEVAADVRLATAAYLAGSPGRYACAGTCPYCDLPSVMVHPRDSREAFCSTPTCVGSDGLPRRWTRDAVGRWRPAAIPAPRAPEAVAEVVAAE